MATDRELLEGALKFGEGTAELAIEYAFKTRDLRRAMWRAIHQLRVGKPAAALQTLEGAVADDHQRKAGTHRERAGQDT